MPASPLSRHLRRGPLALALLLAGASALPAQDAAPNTVTIALSEADVAWNALMGLANPRPEGATRQERTLARDALIQALHTRIRDFTTTYPTDPRRWQGVVLTQRLQPSFITTFGPDFEAKGGEDATIDTAAQAALQTEIATLRLAMAHATDVPPEVRVQSDTIDLVGQINAASDTPEKPTGPPSAAKCSPSPPRIPTPPPCARR